MKLEKTVITVGRDEVCDEQVTGVLADVNEDFVLMKMVSDAGEFDGFTVFPIGQITEVIWGNREHRCIAELLKKKTTISSPPITLDSIEGILAQLREEYDAVALMADGDETEFDVAQIITVDEDWVKIHCYGTTKTLSRIHKIVSIDSFSRIEFDTPYINKLLYLHRQQI